MKIKSIYGIILSTLLLMSGCSTEKHIESDELPLTKVSLSVDFPMPFSLTLDDENAIKKFRMIVFTTNRTGYEQGQMVVNKLVYASSATQSVILNEIVPVGYLNIYFIANESDSWGLGSVTTTAALKSKVIAYGNTYPTPEFPMFSEYKQVKIDINGNTTHNGEPIVLNAIERNVSKVSLKLNCEFDAMPTPITLTEASIVNMPITSTLYPSLFNSSQESDFFNGAATTLSIGTNLEAITSGSGGFKTTGDGIDFYIPEYLITQASEYTYVFLKGYVTSNPGITVKYRLPIGNGIKENTPAKLVLSGTIDELTITRNIHYTFNANIKSLGEMDGVEVIPGIKPWNPQDVPGDNTAPYLNVSALETTTYDAAVSRVYFWSNQPSVVVDEMTSDIVPVEVNTLFDRLAGVGAANLHFNAATKTGYIDIVNRLLEGAQQTKIYLRSGLLRRELTITRNISAQGAQKISTPYIGTFHRWDQTGERVVTWSNSGAWTAEVDDPTGRGAEVVIDREPSPAMVDGTLYTNTPTEAESSKVSEGKQVRGINTVYFRVGWKSVAPNHKKPRYARILVKNGIGILTNVLYLRQGEADDYLMRPTGDVGINIVGGVRSVASKFSPYNITSTTFDTPLAVNGGRFTAYPTQAGAYFQWVSPAGKERMAYSPYTTTVSGFQVNATVSEYWDTHRAIHETCPEGYRRPNDGIIYANMDGAVDNSEVAQSLWLNPEHGEGPSSENIVFGYYADGFFDRRTIVDGPGVYPANNTSVSTTNSSIAHIGNIFYNPNTYASLFFPAAGHRLDEASAEITNIGVFGSYWLGSRRSNWDGSHLMLWFEDDTYRSRTRISYVAPIRCVKIDYEYPSRHIGWAGSNIYWDAANSRFTFDDIGVTIHEHYQGVFFRWGSLMGISPKAVSGSTYTVMTMTGGVHSDAYTWAQIPYISNYDPTRPDGKQDRDRAYLYVHHDPSAGVGDICRYISEKSPAPPGGRKWRMPTAKELGSLPEYTTRIPSTGGFIYSANESNYAGDFPIASGRRYSKTGVRGTPFFPASGYRDSEGNGASTNVGYEGYAWTSSGFTGSGYSLWISGSSPNPNTSISTSSACLPVRCVAE